MELLCPLHAFTLPEMTHMESCENLIGNFPIVKGPSENLSDECGFNELTLRDKLTVTQRVNKCLA